MPTGVNDPSPAPPSEMRHSSHTAYSPYPLTRASALERWRTALLAIGGIQCALISLVTIFSPNVEIDDDGSSLTLVEPLLASVVVPLLLVAMTLHAERRLYVRPPKPLLFWQFGLFFSGTLLETVVILLSSAGGSVASELPLAADGVQLLSFGAIAVWYTGVWLVGRGSDTD